MGFNKTWDEKLPADSENLGYGATAIRDLKTATRERLAIDHNFKNTEGEDANIGKHNQIQLIEKTEDPDTPTAGIVLYDKSGKVCFMKKDETIKVIPETTDDLEEGDTNKYDNNNVKLSDDQEIEGIKTFKSIPVLPSSDPTSDNQAVRKKYVDDKTAQIMIVVDEKTNGTHGGTFTSGAWRTRDLNTVRYNTISGASLASNQITLPAGTYKISASAPLTMVGNGWSKLRLYNISDSADVDGCISDNWGARASGEDMAGRVLLNGTFTIAGAKVFELQHYASKNCTFGGAANIDSKVEVYAQVYIAKIA